MLAWPNCWHTLQLITLWYLSWCNSSDGKSDEMGELKHHLWGDKIHSAPHCLLVAMTIPLFCGSLTLCSYVGFVGWIEVSLRESFLTEWPFSSTLPHKLSLSFALFLSHTHTHRLTQAKLPSIFPLAKERHYDICFVEFICLYGSKFI